MQKETDIILAFKNLQSGDEDWQTAESHNDEEGISIYIERIETPYWMNDCFLYTVIDTQEPAKFEGSWDDVIERYQPQALYLKALSIELGFELYA